VDLVGVGLDSGIETRQEVWYVYFLEHGRVVSQHALSSESEALELLGRGRGARSG
jgi:hypothetical protein